MDKGQYKMWVFDLNQAGFVVRYENRIASSSVVIRKLEFQQVDDIWIPKKTMLDHFDLVKKQWIDHVEEIYIDSQVNVDVESEFGIKSLPLSNDVSIMDSRTGRSVEVKPIDID